MTGAEEAGGKTRRGGYASGTVSLSITARVLPCPFEIPGFPVKQYWHARYHHDAANRWLRGVCADLFMENGSSP